MEIDMELRPLNFSEKVVRDLIWALASPSPFAAWESEDGISCLQPLKYTISWRHGDTILEWLQKIDSNPDHLISWLLAARGFQKIGIIF